MRKLRIWKDGHLYWSGQAKSVDVGSASGHLLVYGEDESEPIGEWRDWSGYAWDVAE